jgi:hypothetical protein
LERVKYELNRCWYSAEVMNAHTIAFRLVGSGKRFTMSNQTFNPGKSPSRLVTLCHPKHACSGARFCPVGGLLLTRRRPWFNIHSSGKSQIFPAGLVTALPCEDFCGILDKTC